MLRKYYEKYLNIPVAARAAMWFVICSLLQKTITFITTPIFTRLIPSDQFGIFNTYQSVYSIVVVLCTLSMEKCIYINNVSKAKTEEEKNYAAIPLLSLSFVITVIVFLVYMLFQNPINKLVGLPSSLMYLMFIHAFCEPAIAFFSVKKRFEFKYIPMVLVTILMVIFNTSLGILFVLYSNEEQAFARVLSIVIVQLVFALGIYCYFIFKAHALFSFTGWRHALNVQIPLLPHSLSLIILSSSDRIMINTLVGESQAAYYGVSYSAGYVIGTLKNSIVNALTPWIYQKIKEKDYDSIKRITNTLQILIMFLTFGMIAFAPELVSIMGTEEYYEGIYVIPPVAASSFFTFLYSMYSSISFYYERTKLIMCASVVGSIMNIVLNLIFIPKLGYVAAGYTTLVCYIFFTIAHYFVMRSICKKEMDNVVLFDNNITILLSVIVILMCILFSYIYEYILIRYLVLLVITIILYIKRKPFIDSIKMIRKKK